MIFLKWLLGARFGETHRNLTADLVCFFVLTPLVRKTQDHLALRGIHKIRDTLGLFEKKIQNPFNKCQTRKRGVLKYKKESRILMALLKYLNYLYTGVTLSELVPLSIPALRGSRNVLYAATRHRSSNNELRSSLSITNRTRYRNSDNETLV